MTKQDHQHIKNEHGVCVVCAMGRAEEYAQHQAEACTDIKSEQEKLKRRFLWQEFLKLTQP